MKKNFKLVLALVVAIMMVLGSVAALAADGDPKLINPSTSKHTYEVYQIFTGAVADGKLTNIKLGQNAVGYTAGGANTLNQAQMTYLASLNPADNVRANDETDIANMAQFMDLTSTPYIASLAPGAQQAVPVGYYLLKDISTSPSDKETTKTLYLLQVVGQDITITAKDSTVTVEKKVDDENDSSTAEDGLSWQDTADYDVGDHIPYRLKGTLPSAYDTDYDFFDYKFTDTLSDGLTLDADSVRVVYYANEAALTTDTTGTAGTTISDTLYTATKQDHKLEISFTSTWTGDGDNKTLNKKGLKEITDLTKDSVIVVYYTATLNQNAVIGGTGNPNTVTLEFSNNPNASGDGDNSTTTTPPDTNIVFTYEVNVDKVDENNQPLSGAKFTLYKKVIDNATFTTAKKGSAIKTDLGNTIKAAALEDDTYYISLGEIEATANGTKFTASFKKIDDGDYVLVETVVPTGYNAWDAKSFTVTADHTQDPAELKITSLSGTGALNFGELIKNSSLTTSILNQSGVTLPSTGGIGTTIFYVAGSIMVLAAAILLITKRRMGSNE